MELVFQRVISPSPLNAHIPLDLRKVSPAAFQGRLGKGELPLFGRDKEATVAQEGVQQAAIPNPLLHAFLEAATGTGSIMPRQHGTLPLPICNQGTSACADMSGARTLFVPSLQK